MGGTSTHPDSELRDEIGQLIAWSQRTGRNSHSVAADILALPRVARALARDTAIEKAFEESTPSGRAPVIDGRRSFYGFEVLNRLRSVGVSHD